MKALCLLIFFCVTACMAAPKDEERVALDSAEIGFYGYLGQPDTEIFLALMDGTDQVVLNNLSRLRSAAAATNDKAGGTWYPWGGQQRIPWNDWQNGEPLDPAPEGKGGTLQIRIKPYTAKENLFTFPKFFGENNTGDTNLCMQKFEPQGFRTIAKNCGARQATVTLSTPCGILGKSCCKPTAKAPACTTGLSCDEINHRCTDAYLDCNESQYWRETSDKYPYPGTNCKSGPKKTIGVTAFVPKDPRTGNYIVDAAEVDFLLEKWNQGFKRYGIEFSLKETVFSQADTSGYADLTPEQLGGAAYKQKLEEYFETIYDSRYDADGINLVFISDWHGSTASASHPWNTAPEFGKPRVYSLPHHISAECLQKPACRAAQFTPMVHEMGHFLGLAHTHSASEFDDLAAYQRFLAEAGPAWQPGTSYCHKTGDFICDTPEDCLDNCQAKLGCAGLVPATTLKGAYENKCGGDYSPSISNIMSYYNLDDQYRQERNLPQESWFTREQGARARHYLMFRMGREINGNQPVSL